ncbi:trehalose-6-phosphate synthase [Chloroflexota bacterium]
MITAERLQKLVRDKLTDYLFIIVSNREPYIHIFRGNDIECIVPASGLTVALDPVMRACGGIWIAHGGGDADREVVDEHDKVSVPCKDPKYSLRRVWLSKDEEDGYYYGFSNEAIWPLCHTCYTRPIFKESDWDMYKSVNERFAQVVLEEAGDQKSFVFVQDYQLALLPRFIKKRNPDIIVAQFWHIPWPMSETFRICPWHGEILDGLLGNDLLGFHVNYYCNNFLDAVDYFLEARVDREESVVKRRGKSTLVRSFPISVDFTSLSNQAQQTNITEEMERLRNQFGLKDNSESKSEFIGIGIDRLDYTKGIPDRLRAIDCFLQKNPRYQGQLVFIQIGVPSRTYISAYIKLYEEVTELVQKINRKYAFGHWRPIRFIPRHESSITLSALYRMADFCIVSSLHDGMNMVAKEFVSSRFDEDGVLILSPFTGAARELTDALIVNPYATDELARAIKQAIEMDSKEKRRRMRRMRSVVQENNIYKWAEDIISELVKFGFEGT